MLPTSDAYPRLAQIVQQQLAIFPDHQTFMERRFANEDAARLKFGDFVSDKIIRIAGDDLLRICEDYKWLCGEVLNEELNFRRTGKYRLSKFEDALKQVYNDHIYMTRYMNGLLASQIWWVNHTDVLRAFRDKFVAGNPPGFSHLEIGPGHGLFLYLSAISPNCAQATGWDISDASIDNTRTALKALGAPDNVRLEKVDLFASPKASFQSITFSEVLEHLEDPLDALRRLYGLLAPGGRIFINAPVNSPAPDHIFLFSKPEDIVDMVEKAGFRVVDTLFAPCVGATLERARKLQLSISTAIIATK